MKNCTQNGNAFLYILIGIALFAALTLVISRGQDSGEMMIQSKTQLDVNAQKLINYANVAAQTVLEMERTGTSLAELDVEKPADAGYTTPPFIHKIFHSGGGGLIYDKMITPELQAPTSAPHNGWAFDKVDADWSPTSATDLFMLYLNTSKQLCETLNQKIIGNTTIPHIPDSFLTAFNTGVGTLTQADCPDCAKYPMICLENDGRYAFVVTLGLQ